jgi:predicted dithiol-disulfide oxidoreductase (DUF899 family)
MGWSFTWVSSARNEFNYDYMVSSSSQFSACTTVSPTAVRPV